MSILSKGLVGLIALILYGVSAQALEVSIDPGDYQGQWAVSPGGTFAAGAQTLDLAPNTYFINYGDGGNGTSFVLDGAGNVTSDTTRLDIVNTMGGSSITFQTTPVSFDPGAYLGQWALGRATGIFLSGQQTIDLVVGGTGTDDAGNR